MKYLPLRLLGGLALLAGGLATSVSWADPMSAVQLLRISGCGGIMPAIAPLQRNLQLDRAAAAWAAGDAAATAAGHSGYQAHTTVGLRLSGTDDAILQSLRRTRCRMVADQSLRDVGVYRRGPQTWLLIAAPNADRVATSLSSPAQKWTTPAPEPDADEAPPRTFGYATAPRLSRTPAQSTRVLQLVNEARATGTRCGAKSFGPAPPLQPSATLDGVAAEHANDMARHDYFEHVDLTGHTPADRLRATGYKERLVGENIAYGLNSADEVVAGWLHSPDHCENIMDPRFVEMGVALSQGHGSRRGLYWDQELAEPAK
ncbi:MAG: CAP domain-containing protein [Steroidobacteraceae bacterium]